MIPLKKHNFNDRTGEIGFNKFGSKMIIQKYRTTCDIVVKFCDKNEVEVKTQYIHFKNGSVCNPFDKSVYKTGFIGVGCFIVSKDKIHTPEYECWHRIFERCYNKNFQNIHPSYKSCTVYSEWHNFQNFAEWYKDNFYHILNERMEIDKDILIKGNKVYGPQTCCFVPQKINALFVKNDIRRGLNPIGVSFKNSEHFSSQCSFGTGKQKYLGFSESPEEAFNTYKEAKENYIKQVAEQYKDKIPDKLYQALLNYKVEITD